MSVPIARLTGRKLNSLHKAVAQPSLSPNFANFGPGNPHLRVFVAHFDGTQNDYKDVALESQETLVADSYKSMPNSNSIASRYYAGVGTRTDGFMGLIQSVFGIGCESRAEKAYAQLAEATRQWRLTDPLVTVHVHVVGFSRGAATGLHFMNLVHERGIVNLKVPRSERRPQSKHLAPGHVKTSAVLLDTVATGQNDILKLGLPPSAVSVLHITAGGEQRYLFPLQSLTDSGRPSEIAQAYGVRLPGSQEEVVKDLEKVTGQSDVDSPTLPAAVREPITYRRLHQVMLDGACHSDVGGSYRSGGIRLVSTYMMKEFQASLGLPVTSIKPSFSQIQNMYAHDSRYFIDKLTSARPYRKGMRRIIDDGAVTHWDGSVTESVTIDSRLKGVKTQSETIRHISPSIHADGAYMQFSEEQLGQEYKLTVRLPDATKGEKGKMVFESTPPGVFGRRSGSRRFMFFGKALSAAPTAEAIIARLEAGEKAFKLVVKLEKAVPVFDSGLTSKPRYYPAQDLPDVLQGTESPDDWTPEIRRAILRFNFGTPQMIQANANVLMRECVASAAAALHKIPGATNMQITFRSKLWSVNGRGVGISLSTAPGRLSPSAECFSIAEKFANSLEDGLTCLAHLVTAKGVNAYSACNMVVEPIPEPEEISVYPKRVPVQKEGAGAIISILRPDSIGDISYDEQSLWARLKEASKASPSLRPSILSSSTPAPSNSKPRKVDKRMRM